MNPKQIRQAFERLLVAMNTAPMLYKITVEPYSKIDGAVHATNANGCKWFVYYSVTDGGLVWNEWEIELPVVPDGGKVD